MKNRNKIIISRLKCVIIAQFLLLCIYSLMQLGINVKSYRETHSFAMYFSVFILIWHISILLEYVKINPVDYLSVALMSINFILTLIMIMYGGAYLFSEELIEFLSMDYKIVIVQLFSVIISGVVLCRCNKCIEVSKNDKL